MTSGDEKVAQTLTDIRVLDLDFESMFKPAWFIGLMEERRFLLEAVDEALEAARQLDESLEKAGVPADAAPRAKYAKTFRRLFRGPELDSVIMLPSPLLERFRPPPNTLALEWGDAD